MWEEQERRRWTEDQERRNRRRVEVQKRVDVQRDVQQQTLRAPRPSEPVTRRRLEVERLPPLEEVSRVPRPITARSIGDSLERADHHLVDHHHHPGAGHFREPGTCFLSSGAFGPPADQRNIEAAVAAGAAAYHAVSDKFLSFGLDLTLSGWARTSKEIVVPNPWSRGTEFLQIWLRHRPRVRCHVAFAFNSGLFS